LLEWQSLTAEDIVACVQSVRGVFPPTRYRHTIAQVVSEMLSETSRSLHFSDILLKKQVARSSSTPRKTKVNTPRFEAIVNLIERSSAIWACQVR
jgi:hypothetical protein